MTAQQFNDGAGTPLSAIFHGPSVSRRAIVTTCHRCEVRFEAAGLLLGISRSTSARVSRYAGPSVPVEIFASFPLRCSCSWRRICTVALSGRDSSPATREAPGGTLSLEEAQDWIRRLPTFLAHIKATSREAKVSFELWTSGVIAEDALAYLLNEQSKRTKHPIAWRAGKDVLLLATGGREKAIADALKQHFLHHPLSRVVVVAAAPVNPHPRSPC